VNSLERLLNRSRCLSMTKAIRRQVVYGQALPRKTRFAPDLEVDIIRPMFYCYFVFAVGR
jgi:hypothetical protein